MVAPPPGRSVGRASADAVEDPVEDPGAADDSGAADEVEGAADEVAGAAEVPADEPVADVGELLQAVARASIPARAANPQRRPPVGWIRTADVRLLAGGRGGCKGAGFGAIVWRVIASPHGAVRSAAPTGN